MLGDGYGGMVTMSVGTGGMLGEGAGGAVTMSVAGKAGVPLSGAVGEGEGSGVVDVAAARVRVDVAVLVAVAGAALAVAVARVAVGAGRLARLKPTMVMTITTMTAITKRIEFRVFIRWHHTVPASTKLAGTG